MMIELNFVTPPGFGDQLGEQTKSRETEKNIFP